MSTNSHTGRGSGNGTQDNRREPAFLWKVRSCLGLLPIPEEQQEKACGGRGQGWGTVSGALPDTHSQGPPEVQVQEVLHLMCDLKAEAFANHHVPGGAELLVHGLFDHLGGALEPRGCSSEREVSGREWAGVSASPESAGLGKRKACCLISLFCLRNLRTGFPHGDPPARGCRYTGTGNQTLPHQSGDAGEAVERPRA